MELKDMTLQDVEARLSAIEGEIEAAEEVEAVNTLADEKRSLLDRQAELKDLAERKADAKAIESREITGNKIEENTKMEEKRTFAVDTMEYRDAFMKKLQGKELTAEERAAVTASAAIPTVTMNKIIGILERTPLIAAVDVTYNTICPVGTLLGFFSRFSLLRIRIDQNKCNHCLACQRKCKAYCIDSKNQQIDYSRCVDCFDCIEACKQKALYYGPVKNRKEVPAADTVDESKRQFLKSSLVIAALAPAALEAKVTGKKDERVPMSPPGSISHRNLLQHCTACHLCVSKCPSHVLKPAGMEYGLGGLMQPVMKFDDGYCNYDCNLCSQVCPAGAIKPLTVEEKHSTQPGRVVFNKDICVVNVNRTSCGACAEHCPVQAIHMVPFEGGLTIPETTPELCVGCGGCEYICPVKAVHIEGNPIHLTAKAPEQDQNIQTEDFDFGF